MHNVFKMSLSALQPSQLYISQEKLSAVIETFDPANPFSVAPIPVKEMGERYVMTDGHARAFAAFMAGLDYVNVTWDRDELNDEAYAICVEWCLNEGIRQIGDLAGRVVSAEAYSQLWLNRCREMRQALITNTGNEIDYPRTKAH